MNRESLMKALCDAHRDSMFTCGDIKVARGVTPFVCSDGFKVSVQVGEYLYSTPRLNEQLEYSHVECGFPTEVVECWLEYAENTEDPIESVYPYIPWELVADELLRRGVTELPKARG